MRIVGARKRASWRDFAGRTRLRGGRGSRPAPISHDPGLECIGLASSGLRGLYRLATGALLAELPADFSTYPATYSFRDVDGDGRDEGGRDAASGIYFHELDVEGRRQSSKARAVALSGHHGASTSARIAGGTGDGVPGPAR